MYKAMCEASDVRGGNRVPPAVRGRAIGAAESRAIGAAAGRAIGSAAGLLALLLGGAPAHAQEPPARDRVKLSLADAVLRATTLNETVLMARAEQARTIGIVREVRSQSLPQITADINYTRNIQRPVLFFNTPEGVQQISLGNDNDYTFALRLEQSLMDFSLGPARRAARLTRDATGAQVEQARTSAALQARVDYFTVLLDRELLRVQEQALAQAEARLAQVEMMSRAGTASEFDLLTAQVEVDNIQPQLIEARNRLALDTNRLKRTVNLPLDAALELTDGLARPGETPAEPAADRGGRGAAAPEAGRRSAAELTVGEEGVEDQELSRWIQSALLRRPDLAAQRTTVQLHQQNLTSQRRSALPEFDLVAGITRRGSSDEFFPGERDFSQSATAGLVVSLPLFDGRERAGRVQQAQAARDRERYALERLEKDVRLDVQQSLQALRAAREQVAASESNVRRAERALEIAQTRFRNGLSTQVELNDAELAATRARTNYAQALYNYNVARAALQAAAGER
ncbi:MAG: TolC family protein [Gemmatimonadota bacterium]